MQGSQSTDNLSVMRASWLKDFRRAHSVRGLQRSKSSLATRNRLRVHQFPWLLNAS